MLTLKVRLYGGFEACWSDGAPTRIGGPKQRALLALLLTAKNGLHSREWLQQTLWSYGDREQGRVNLRRALHELRKALGGNKENIVGSSYTDIWIDLNRIEIVGDQRDGEFLQGLTLPEPGFQNWLVKQREFGFKPACAQNINTGDQQQQKPVLPSITILPLQLISGEKQHAGLGDLISMEFLRALSNSNILNVISHLSSREFGGTHLTLSDLKSALKADYVANGFLRVSGDMAVIDMELTDCQTGQMSWSQRFDLKLEELFNSHSSAIHDTATRIGYALTSTAVELANTKPFPDLESHQLFIAGVCNMHSDRLSAYANSRKCLEYLIGERGIADSRIHAWLAQWYMLGIPQGWSQDPAKDLAKAQEHVSRALDINSNCSLSLSISGLAYNSNSLSSREADAQLALAKYVEPNNPLAWLFHARLHAFRGDSKLAVENAEHAIRLSPGGPQAYLFENIAATAYVTNGDPTRAIDLIEKSLAKNRNHRSSLRVKAVAHELAGNEDKARETVNQLRLLDPDLTVSSYLANHPAGDRTTGLEWAQSLARSGLPD